MLVTPNFYIFTHRELFSQCLQLFFDFYKIRYENTKLYLDKVTDKIWPICESTIIKSLNKSLDNENINWENEFSISIAILEAFVKFYKNTEDFNSFINIELFWRNIMMKSMHENHDLIISLYNEFFKEF